jgi:hypothetical protein
MKIKSRNSLFLGEKVDKPKRVRTTIYDAEGEPIMKCPHCKAMITYDDCDVCGAEPGCMFCNKCNREIEP